MPEYLAPGVFVEEVSYPRQVDRGRQHDDDRLHRADALRPDRRRAGDRHEPGRVRAHLRRPRSSCAFARPRRRRSHNYMWHAVRAFFENGGKRLYVQRVFRPGRRAHRRRQGSRARRSTGGGLVVRSRFPASAARAARADHARARAQPARARAGAGGRDARSPRPLDARRPRSPTRTVLRGLRRPRRRLDQHARVARVAARRAAPASFYLATLAGDRRPALEWTFTPTGGGTPLELGDLQVDPRDPDVLRPGPRRHGDRHGLPDRRGRPAAGLGATCRSIPSTAASARRTRSLAPVPPSSRRTSAGARTVPIVIDGGDGRRRRASTLLDAPARPRPAAARRRRSRRPATTVERALGRPAARRRQRRQPARRRRATRATPRDTDDKTGLKAFEDLEDISIVAAPGSTFGYENGLPAAGARRSSQLLISPRRADALPDRRARLAATARRSREVRAHAGQARLQARGALLPVGPRSSTRSPQREIHLPPSGFVAGIYARNDIERARLQGAGQRGRHAGASASRRCSTRRQQDVLNPEGINCFRFFEGRGIPALGRAHDQLRPGVEVRQPAALLRLPRALDRQGHAVGGVRAERRRRCGRTCAARSRTSCSTSGRSGALLGDKPEKAFFVKCDRSTMTQNDLDNGRLVCLIGVAPLRPAEFVIFRIGQWTADRKSC